MTANLKALTTEELQAELARRNKPPTPTPQPVGKPDWTALVEMCQAYLDDPDRDNDFEQYIFECAIETVYGKDIWEWVNAQ